MTVHDVEHLFSSARLASGQVRILRVLALVVLVWVTVTTSSVQAANLSVTGAPGIVVVPATDVLENHTFRAPDGTLVFVDNAGLAYALIEDPSDPEIANSGDGSFHSFDAPGVVETLTALPGEIRAGLHLTVFVLPYPRRGITSSTATSSAVFLCPGVYPIGNDVTLHSIVTHEIGHVWQKQFLSDPADPSWQEYLTLRGITDEATFNAQAPHAYRPNEIFAEDFRVLMGDALAQGTGEVENPELAAPGDDPGLVGYFVSLVAAYATAKVSSREIEELSRVYPNPVPVGQFITVEFAGQSREAMVGPRRVSVLDVRGRVIDELEVDPQGRLLIEREWGTGVFWLREKTGGSRPVRLTVVASR